MFGGNSPSLADIAAVTGNNRSGDDGFGGNNGWWVLIILFALFGGWGRGGYGANDGGSSNGNGGGTTTVIPVPYYGMGGFGGGYGYIDSAIQRGFDNQGVTNKLNGLENGICGLGYDQLAQMNQIGQAIATNGYQTRDAISQLGFALQNTAQQNEIANMQRSFAQQTQTKDCCCQIENMMADAAAQRAANTCTITTQAASNTRDIVDAVNGGTNRIIDYLCNQENQRLRDENMWYKFDASQNRQNSYINTLFNPPYARVWPPQYQGGCCNGYGQNYNFG